MKRILFKFLVASTLVILGLGFTACKYGAGRDYSEMYDEVCATLTSSPVKLTDYTGNVPDGIYYKFGDYPQTEVTPEMAANISFGDRPVKNGYFIGKATDGTGAFYEKIGETFYKVEPIIWRVVTSEYDYNNGEKGTLLVSENVLDGINYYDGTGERTIDGNTIYTNNYEHSTLRAFLNGYAYKKDSSEEKKFLNKNFYKAAFGTVPADYIKTTVVKNDGDTTDDKYNNGEWTRSDGYKGINNTADHFYEEGKRELIPNGNVSRICADTNDKVFVLSLSECVDPALGFTSPNSEKPVAHYKKATEYALAVGIQKDSNGYGEWTTRSPHYNEVKVRTTLSSEANYVYNSKSADNLFGIVPAIVVDLN